jgi:hypothetical protein
MEDERKEEKVIETKKGLKWYIVVIVILSLLVLGLGGYIAYDKLISKEDVKEKSNVQEVTTKEESDESIVFDPISEEEAEAFLNDLVPTNVPDDFLVAENDSAVFWNIIKYLYLNNQYTKDGNLFVFDKDVMQNRAYTYYGKDSFDYIDSRHGFSCDDSKHTCSSPMGYELFGMTNPFEKKREITDFSFSNNVATLTYCVKRIYRYDERYPGSMDEVVTINYIIKLIKENGVLRIREVSKQ